MTDAGSDTQPLRPVRVAGHTLRHEGRPVLVAGCCGSLDNHGQRNHYDRMGHGICSCGAVSPCEDTVATRQRWHRQHKSDSRKATDLDANDSASPGARLRNALDAYGKAKAGEDHATT